MDNIRDSKTGKTIYTHYSEYFDEAYYDYIEPIAKGELIPLRTSIKTEMDLLRGFLPTDHITIAGRSGTGKTSRIIHLIKDIFNPVINPSFHDRVIVLYDSWEISGWRNAVKFISMSERMTYHDILNWDDRLTAEKLFKIKALRDEFKNKPFFISEFPNTSDEWYARKKKIQKAYPNHLIVNVVDHTRLTSNENDESEKTLIDNFLKVAIDQKKELKQINFFLSQMNRNIEFGVARKEIGNQLPIASDIYGSDMVYQASDILMALHRPGMYELQQFHYKGYDYMTGVTNDSNKDNLMVEVVLKQRNGDNGVLFLEHELEFNNFKDVDLSKIKREKEFDMNSLEPEFFKRAQTKW